MDENAFIYGNMIATLKPFFLSLRYELTWNAPCFILLFFHLHLGVTRKKGLFVSI